MMRDRAIAELETAARTVYTGADRSGVAASVVVRWLSAFSRCTLV